MTAVNSLILTEINLLANSLKTAMSTKNDAFAMLTNGVSQDNKFYQFMNWAIDQNWNNEPSLLNDIVCLPNERLSQESYSEYKDRQFVVRKCKQYRKYFMNLLIEKNNWDKRGN